MEWRGSGAMIMGARRPIAIIPPAQIMTIGGRRIAGVMVHPSSRRSGRRSASGGHRHDTCDDEDDGGRRIIPIDDRARGCGGGNPMPAREGWTLERGQADADNNLQTSPH